MNEKLCDKLGFLSSKDRLCFCNRLYDILNDRYSSFTYGISDKEYANPSPEKIQQVKEKLYEEMFNRKAEVIPSKCCIEDLKKRIYLDTIELRIKFNNMFDNIPLSVN